MEFAAGMGRCHIVWHYIYFVDHVIENYALQSNIGLIDLNVHVFLEQEKNVAFAYRSSRAHTPTVHIQHNKCNIFETIWIY